MSFCVIGMKRTRSSILTYSIANYYDSDNYFGSYDGITPKFKDQIYFSRLPKTEQRDAKLDFFKSGIKELTTEFFEKGRPNSVIKLFPRYMIFHNEPSIKNHANCFLPKDYNDLIMITDIEECFSLSKFKKIYLLKRNVTDAICSYGYGIYLNKFQFKDDSQVNTYKKLAKPISINMKDGWLDFCIFESMLLDHLQNYLDRKQILYHLLDYNEVPEYCDRTYSSEKYYKYPNFDYKNLILNYDEVDDYIKNFVYKNTDYVQNNIIFK